MKNTNVTAIVSAYYAKDFIRERLDNLYQMKPVPEVVVVAQLGSTEAAIAKTYDCIWVLTPDVPTIYAAWNLAIKAANCDYITNANCDDHTYLDSYAIMSNILDGDPTIGVVYGDDYIKTIVNEEPMYALHQRGQVDFKVLQSKCLVGPMPMWRKSLHDQYGYFDEKFRVCGDYEMWLRLAYNGIRFHHINIPVGVYSKRAASAEHRDIYVAMLENQRVRQKYA